MITRDIGRLGETKAVRHLKRLGYRILERNLDLVTGEIDIVAMDGDVVVFVEVKTRGSIEYGNPSDFVSATQRRRYIRSAEAYMSRPRMDGRSARFDVIEVLGKDINHIIDAFRA